MTSCDGNLVKYILPQLTSINKNLSDYDIHFYLAHSRIFPKEVQALKLFAQEKTSITFHEVKVTKNIPFYESLVTGGGGQWPQEAYFTLRVQDYIPDDVDRIMYIDAGDVIINGDIAPYYFGDFEGKSLIASQMNFKINPSTNERELYTKNDVLTVAACTLFNSGSYIINMEKLRKEGCTVNEYVKLRDTLLKNSKNGQPAYFGDQGFLSAVFAGDINFFGYPQYKDSKYMPYNFRTSYWGMFDGEPDYEPVVLHYAIMSKPWVVRFTEKDINAVIDKPDFVAKRLTVPIPTIACMTPQHLRLGEVWWKYAKETPIYEEANTRATITAESWVKHYLPLCARYVDVCNQIAQIERN